MDTNKESIDHNLIVNEDNKILLGVHDKLITSIIVPYGIVFQCVLLVTSCFSAQ